MIRSAALRKKIYQVVEVAENNDKLSSIYDVFMMITIVISLVPLMTKSQNTFLSVIDIVTVFIFIVDYLMRLLTADYKLNKRSASFLLYPFTPMAILDLLTILASVSVLNSGFKVLKLFRLLRTFRVLRVFKAFRYSKNVAIILDVFKKQKEALTVVGVLAVGYIFVTALIIFNVEPDTFPTFFDAIYWATISLTTVGYGDIYAVSNVGKVLTMVSSLLGIAIVALPAGIVTAGYMEAVSKQDDDKGFDE